MSSTNASCLAQLTLYWAALPGVPRELPGPTLRREECYLVRELAWQECYLARAQSLGKSYLV